MAIIFHVDVNNAFLSWSAIYLLQNGASIDIRTIPSIIGGDEKSRKGIVLAKSQVAKKYGIQTAEPIYTARKKCHNLQVFPPNYAWYKAQSKKLVNYLAQYTPTIEQYSIDECFLDMTGTTLLYGNNYTKLARKMADEIYQKFGFTVNVGIGENKLCAKMASDFEKPNKVHTLYQNEIKSKMWPLPVEELFMLGKSSAKKLKSLGIYTIGQLAQANIAVLTKHFKNQAIYFKQASMGIDNSKVIPKTEQNKCISISRTLPYDITTKESLEKILLKETEDIAFTLRQKKLYAKTIAIIYKNNIFKSYSHQLSLDNAICTTDEIYQQVILILKNSWKEDPIRNIGIRLSDLSANPNQQLSLFTAEEEKQDEEIEKLMDQLITKFGKNSIMRASHKEHHQNDVIERK